MSKDIDWFVQINNSYVHVASAGGLLPSSVNDREKLRNIQYQVNCLPYLYKEEDVIVNFSFVRQLSSIYIDLNGAEDEVDTLYFHQYLESFISFARKGFISMDRTDVNDPFSNHYHVVCAPKQNVNYLPIDGLLNVTSNDFPQIDYLMFENNPFANGGLDDIQLLNFIR